MKSLIAIQLFQYLTQPRRNPPMADLTIRSLDDVALEIAPREPVHHPWARATPP